MLPGKTVQTETKKHQNIVAMAFCSLQRTAFSSVVFPSSYKIADELQHIGDHDLETEVKVTLTQVSLMWLFNEIVMSCLIYQKSFCRM
jgi:hypothetical protein